MFRAAAARYLVFAPRVDGTRTTGGRGHASNNNNIHSTTTSSVASKRPRRGFLATSSHKTDPHTRSSTSTTATSAQQTFQPFQRGIDKVSVGTASSNRRGQRGEHGAELFDPLQSPAEVRQRRLSRTAEAADATRQTSRTSNHELPSDYYETKAPNSSERRATRMREILKQRAVSSVEITKGGEADIDLGGLPQDQYHGKDGWTTLPEESSMYQNIINKDALPSRESYNSWSILKRQQELHDRNAASTGSFSTRQGEKDATKSDVSGDNAATEHHQDEVPNSSIEKEVFLQSRAGSAEEWRKHNGTYRTTFDDNVTLLPMRDAVSYSRSTYALRKLYLDGMSGYMDIITQHEELSIAEEVMTLTQSPTACYIAEEMRYCVNLVDLTTPLGIPSKDPLAFPFHRCPTLMTVLQRLVDLRLVSMMPNVVQLSEFVGNFSGYPPHCKPHTIGPYLGILNLVSPAVLQTRHVQHPWAPRMLLQPRSLFVVEPPCLQEYAIGYAATHQPFHNFDYATRLSADYRIEILFAAVDIPNTKLLRETVAMTEYAASKKPLLASGASVSSASSTAGVDAAIQRLSSVVRGGAPPTSAEEAKAALHGEVGSRAVPLKHAVHESSTSAAKRRIAELKARHQHVQDRLKGISSDDGASGAGVYHRGGANVIQGHKPGPKRL
ncbi:Hypothetical protein, putative [Bodo saltans]|uniref:Uncharacterized protein n=1 Tax=Bodo saltans TaxID=75058 RepID=A0A0S4JET6_BODSA|nr:Hypothetical protein, putative [Bodo saltans]|eukprot:CUG87937.1 Hypothetical protein, putative [Bodo saltans]